MYQKNINFSLNPELMKKKHQSRTISERKQTLTARYPTGISLYRVNVARSCANILEPFHNVRGNLHRH